MSRMSVRPNLVLYHNDLDGLASAWVVWRAWLCGLDGGGEHIEFVPVQYGDDPPNVRDRRVLVVDFSWPLRTCERLRAEAEWFYLIDHHKTAAEQLGTPDVQGDGISIETELVGNEWFVVDTTRAACVLVWGHYYGSWPDPVEARTHEGTAIREVLLDVEDRDLWQWQRPDSRAMCAGLSLVDTRQHEALAMQAFDDLVRDRDATIKLGHALLQAQTKRVQRTAAVAKAVDVDGLQWWVVNATSDVSEVAHAVLDEHGGSVAAVWRHLGDKVVVSLRSDGSVDVSELAKERGGGGHPKAAGYALPLPGDERYAVPLVPTPYSWF